MSTTCPKIASFQTTLNVTVEWMALLLCIFLLQSECTYAVYHGTYTLSAYQYSSADHNQLKKIGN